MSRTPIHQEFTAVTLAPHHSDFYEQKLREDLRKLMPFPVTVSSLSPYIDRLFPRAHPGSTTYRMLAWKRRRVLTQLNSKLAYYRTHVLEAQHAPSVKLMMDDVLPEILYLTVIAWDVHRAIRYERLALGSPMSDAHRESLVLLADRLDAIGWPTDVSPRRPPLATRVSQTYAVPKVRDALRCTTSLRNKIKYHYFWAREARRERDVQALREHAAAILHLTHRLRAWHLVLKREY
jgi:hypothetical protein